MKELVGNFIFDSNFDNGNLHKVIEVEEFQPIVNDSKLLNKHEFQDIIASIKDTRVRTLSIQDHINLHKKELYSKSEYAHVKRYCLWTKPDAYDSGVNVKNRTWFYFSVKECSPVMNNSTKSKIIKDRKKNDSLSVLDLSLASINSDNNLLFQEDKKENKISNNNNNNNNNGNESSHWTILQFRIMNLNNVIRLFIAGLRPVWCSSENRKWKKISKAPLYEKVDTGLQVTFEVTIPPQNNGRKINLYYNDEDNVNSLNYDESQKKDYNNYIKNILIHSNSSTKKSLMINPKYFWDHLLEDENNSELKFNYTDIYFNHRVLIRTGSNLNLDLITISSTKSMIRDEYEELNVKNIFPNQMEKKIQMFNYSKVQTASTIDEIIRNKKLQYNQSKKKIIFISARVHPGEVVSSYIVDGIIEYLMRENDVRAKLLRDKFVFKIVPMLNPEGVITDKNGYNLNRVYKNPDENLHPTIWAVKKYIDYLSTIADIEYYIDFHGHANKFGYFTFGNHFFKYPFSNYGENAESSSRFLNDFISQTQSYVFAKLCSLNNKHFSILNCDFSNKNMDLYKSKPLLFSKVINPLSNLSKRDTIDDNKSNPKSQSYDETVNNIEDNNNSTENHEFSTKEEEINKTNNNDKSYQNENKNLESYIPHSKIGSGRVTMYREFGIKHAYTIEANYFCSKDIHEITASEDASCSSPIPLSRNTYIKPYSINTMMSMGHGILTSILEMNYKYINSDYNSRKWSRLATSPLRNLDNVTSWAIEQSEQLLRYTCREYITPKFKDLVQYLLSNKRFNEDSQGFKNIKLLKEAKDKINNSSHNKNNSNERIIVDIPRFMNNNVNDNKNNDKDNSNHERKTNIIDNKPIKSIRNKDRIFHQIMYNKPYDLNDISNKKQNQNCQENNTESMKAYNESNNISNNRFILNYSQESQNNQLKNKTDDFTKKKSDSNIKILSFSKVLSEEMERKAQKHKHEFKKTQSESQYLYLLKRHSNKNDKSFLNQEHEKKINNKSFSSFSCNDITQDSKEWSSRTNTNSIFNINKNLEIQDFEKDIQLKRSYSRLLQEQRQNLRTPQTITQNNVYNNIYKISITYKSDNSEKDDTIISNPDETESISYSSRTNNIFNKNISHDDMDYEKKLLLKKFDEQQLEMNDNIYNETADDILFKTASTTVTVTTKKPKKLKKKYKKRSNKSRNSINNSSNDFYIKEKENKDVFKIKKAIKKLSNKNIKVTDSMESLDSFNSNSDNISIKKVHSSSKLKKKSKKKKSKIKKRKERILVE
ncbi:hypothetical protein BCR36DRAFT_406546 [Piromyces finnis]|uniref:Peptidase M14 domain-containing protein n=1 Tax=Piromyces finnis TaxID=1754191 RepID=A0A1Y1UZT3_9FUNG|nr:hypothetical protein BCR36DRAFT_406546 [Piromyces finnis]|eukprot:ORX44214.1 hypothetical protein BCR36DRAFT_406546 [Piromyces finnis]